MAYDIGPKIGIDGEAEFRRAIQNINTNIKTLGTEMLAVTSAYDANDKSAAALTSRNDVLTKQIDAQKEKLAKLQEGLAASAEKYGENDEKTLRWQQTVNVAVADLNKMERQLAENTSELEGNTGEVQQNTSELKNQGSALDGIREKLNAVGSGLATVAKTAAAGIAAASAAVASLVKSAVEGYSESEQLVGGVETLFKDSSDAVLQYANNAYKTAGLSANEYMETVTSFSASLLQSLGGDTSKAAEVANQAIIDMSDNANKMGSDMESIQNAYNGFAKGTFNMLDNLKLGYGGTKEEMERLLSDAEKLSGQKFDISSYSDIIEAIHVVQTEMGITGTTAKEASTTIQGSIGAMKSAWGNLVTGLAGDTENLDMLVSNFVESIEIAGGNILPRIETILSGIGTLIADMAPIIAEEVPNVVVEVLPSLVDAGTQLLSGLVEGLVGAIPQLTDSCVAIVGFLTETTISLLPELASAALEIISTLASGISSALPELVPAAVDTVLQIVETLTDPDSLGNLIEAALAIIVALADGLVNALPSLAARVPEIIANITSTLASNLPKITESALKIIVTLAAGLITAIPQLVKSIPQLITSIVSGFTENGPKFQDIGKNIVSGVWQGIQNMGSWIKEKVSGFFSGIVDSVKGVLGIHSPSKVFAGIGGYMAEGLGEGFGSEIIDVQRRIDRSMAELAGNASASIDVKGAVTGAPYAYGGGYPEDLPGMIATAVRETLDGMGIYLNMRRVGEMTTDWQKNNARAMGM